MFNIKKHTVFYEPNKQNTLIQKRVTFETEYILVHLLLQHSRKF